LRFSFYGKRNVFTFFSVQQLNRTPAAGIFCAGAFIVFFDTVFQVVGNAGIVGVIAAFDDIATPFLFHVNKALIKTERVGFEPTLRLREDRFSRAAP
jgi:hypothetical protein